MSLVNDMLRDLDARQATEAQDMDVLQSLPAGSKGDRRGILGGAAAALLLAGFIGSYWFFQQPRLGVSSVAQAAQGAVLPAPTQEVVPTEPVVLSVPDAGQERVTASGDSNEEQVSANANAVQQLLAAAEQALAEDRLTQPPVNNAYALYSHVLLLEPENARALAGMERVQTRYEQLVKEAVRMQAWAQARQYLVRAAAVGMPAGRLAALRALVKEPVTAQPVANVVGHPQAQDTAPSAPEASVQRHQVSIEKSWSSREAEAVAQANRLLQQGQRNEAVATLQPVVADYSRAEAAALLLFDIYVRAGEFEPARSLLGQVENPLLNRYFEAKLLAETGQHAEALALMEQQEPIGVVTEPWLALQAALYQQAGAPDKALGLYQRLVQMDSQQVTYWLGLGVAAEAASQPGQALQAFMAANQLQPTNAAVGSYIKQRIEALSR